MTIAADLTEAEPGPYMSARVLGDEFGLSSQNMNLHLRDAGILEGNPGAYGLTAKGLEYGKDEYVDTGPNTGYWMTTYNPAVLDELDLAPERAQQLRAAASAHRKHKVELSKANAVDLWATHPENPDNVSAYAGSPGGVDRRLVIAGGVAVIALAGYGIWTVAPKLKKMWNDRKNRGIHVGDG